MIAYIHHSHTCKSIMYLCYVHECINSVRQSNLTVIGSLKLASVFSLVPAAFQLPPAAASHVCRPEIKKYRRYIKYVSVIIQYNIGMLAIVSTTTVLLHIIIIINYFRYFKR